MASVFVVTRYLNHQHNQALLGVYVIKQDKISNLSDNPLNLFFFCNTDGRFRRSQLLTDVIVMALYLSRLVGKPTMWFPNRFDTNRPVQLKKQARNLKFWS